jgi:hypothetical protein
MSLAHYYTSVLQMLMRRSALGLKCPSGKLHPIDINDIIYCVRSIKFILALFGYHCQNADGLGRGEVSHTFLDISARTF